MTEPLVVPLGRYLGLLPVTTGSRTTLEHIARVGGRRVVLSDDDMLVWALAHGIPGAPELVHWSRAAVRRHAQAEATDVDGTLDRLIGSGLLVELREPAEGFARTVRLLPQALGLGNSMVSSRAFTIGFPGAPLVTVPTGTFYLWSWGCLSPDLWSACVRGAAASVPPGRSDAHGLLAELLAHLHGLLSTNAACLDTAAAS